MRRRLSAVVGFVAIAIAAGALGAGATTNAQRTVRPIGNLAVHLPGSGESLIVLLKVKVAVPHGSIPSVHVRALNESQLPSGIRAFGAVVAPRARKRIATVDVYVGINNLGSAAAGAGHVTSSPQDLEITTYLRITDLEGKPLTVHTTTKLSDLKAPGDCPRMVDLGRLADQPGGLDVFRRIVLTKLADEPASAAEAVLDHVVYNECADQGAEVPEPDEGPE